MDVFCPDCQQTSTISINHWRCPCGGAWEPVPSTVVDIQESESDIWRYSRMFALDFDQPLLRMGTGGTPLVPLSVDERVVLLKLEYVAPTASFKDRGTEVMLNVLAHQGAAHVVDDSSGNAGASVAAFAARAGIQADIFVPAYASPAKQAQIALYGATVHPIPGPRAAAEESALAAAQAGAALASHAYHPAFLAGQQSLAWELWEQLGQRAPDWYVVPVGQGVHLLGVWLGFLRLLQAGHVDRLPHLIAVQPARLAPLKHALDAGADDIAEIIADQPSVAEGLAITQPVRGRRLLQAIRQTGGTCFSVDDDAILRAQQQIARRGFYIEPSSATVIAALDQVFALAAPDDVIVLPLTGNGLKGAPRV